MWRLARGLQRENPFRTQIVCGFAEEFGKQDDSQKSELESSTAIVLLLEGAVDVEIQKRGEAPDLFGIGGAIPQEPAQHADGCEQRHGEKFVMKHGGNRDQNAGEESRDVAAENSGKQTAFEAQIDGE